MFTAIYNCLICTKPTLYMHVIGHINAMLKSFEEASKEGFKTELKIITSPKQDNINIDGN